VSSRSYLSIGDVLTLLREEFPDVTISKIRFLESQGLVNPERSPSGYRKFFEHDVERLRWVLRQQREHFLPLKVIRDRLTEGDPGEDDLPDPDVSAEPVRDAARRNGKVQRPAPAVAAAASLSGAQPEAGAAPPVSRGRTEEQSAKAGDEAMARILADASRRSALMPEGPPRAPLRVVDDVPAPVKSAPPEEKARPAGPVAGAGAVPAVVPGLTEDQRSGSPRAIDRQGAGAAPATTPEPTPKPAAGQGSTRPSSTTPGAGAGGPRAPPQVGGASLTAAELCKASGLSETELAGLQGFGLIEAYEVAGILTFDEDALTVASLAVEFRAYGIEPRHLRLYRNAVDREVGLIEQVIIPLLRQRNPESRQRAVEGADSLGVLGQTMRATLMRSALRRHIGG
jgi:DNA-binding transcriptional MerR regulator